MNLIAAHANQSRFPHCKAVLTRSFARVRADRARRQYGLCRNGCGLFYCDPDGRRTILFTR